MPLNPAERSNKISQESERNRKADQDLRSTLDANWAQQQAEEAEAKRTQAARVAERAKASLAAAAALGPSAPGRGGSSSTIPWKRPPSEQPPKADGIAKLPPPVPRSELLEHPVPSGPPTKACPAEGLQPTTSTFVFAPGSLGTSSGGEPVWAHGTLGTSSSGAVGPGVKWTGPPASSRGPDLGGVYAPASVAGTVVTSFHLPVGAEGKSTVMRKARDKDRGLQALPKSLFHYVPEEDPPILGVAAGIGGPGWCSGCLNNAPNLSTLSPRTCRPTTLLTRCQPGTRLASGGSCTDMSTIFASRCTCPLGSTSRGKACRNKRISVLRQYAFTACSVRKTRVVTMANATHTPGVKSSPRELPGSRIRAWPRW